MGSAPGGQSNSSKKAKRFLWDLGKWWDSAKIQTRPSFDGLKAKQGCVQRN